MSVHSASDEDVGGMDWYWAFPQTDTGEHTRSEEDVGGVDSYWLPDWHAGERSLHAALDEYVAEAD